MTLSLFCSSKNDPEESRPNTNVCPVCLAHPGTLPVINREAVRHVLRVGTALSGTLADYTEFDRKSYFYPDIPKGYQISQYEHPLVAGGSLAGVAITRVHLEEDTARSSHAAEASLIDFNRAGVPLMELVTEPVIHGAETAGNFARELQLLLRTLGASDANLEKGEMRVEANISVSKDDVFGTKVEVKNLNSFRSVERAIEFEVARQIQVLEQGGTLIQETRGWDEGRQETFHQRFKEGSADYRYFPEPDLPKLILSEIPEFTEEAIRKTLPELPWERRMRYISLGIKEADSTTIASNIRGSVFFDQALAMLTSAELRTLGANFFVSDLAGEPGNTAPEAFAELVQMFARDEVSSRGAKDILALLKVEGGAPKAIATEKGLMQVSDTEALREAVKAVLTEHAGVAAEYRAGKVAALQFLVGASMRATKGAGNPGIIRAILEEELAR